MNGQAVTASLSNYDEWFSGALAKWVYLHPAHWNENPESIRILALQRLRFSEEEWIHDFLWRKLRQKKAEDIADWMLIALADHSPVGTIKDIPQLLDLYHDESAHLLARGSAIFVLNNRAEQMVWDELHLAHPVIWSNIRQVCNEALYDNKNAYARAGGCWLAKYFTGFEDRLEELKSDHTKTPNGGPVSDYVD